jgi:hypothetical protein
MKYTNEPLSCVLLLASRRHSLNCFASDGAAISEVDPDRETAGAIF